ncbi:14 kDa phosphohistidine phosphatase [Tetranychus urticae]|uniref:14 kDa phosphohistidine phosphatase n=1 Tax=Tetranychus urticae TaxID=32264 RepID=UPI00077BAAB0|nr:14 kDa phosphohistidine phosphatase [Tetranychus urticae]
MNGIRCLQLFPLLWLQRYSANHSSSFSPTQSLLTCEAINKPSIQSKSVSSLGSPSISSGNLNMENIPEVDIDGRGKFKYIQIKVKDDSGNEKLIIRGHRDAGYHADILERVQSHYPNLRCDCPGGGRILHEPDKKKILVYGYSMGFGRGDHEVTVAILKKHYPDYNIEWNNEGY